jgi:hypothetical protein
MLPPISVIIPIVEKDLSILALNVVNLRKYCQNPITEILVVSPASEKIRKECELLNITWVDEVTVAPVSKESIHQLLGESFRVNWFYQQFMKLNFNTIVDTPQYLVLDADTILLSHQYFADQTHMILKVSDEYHYLYQFTNRNLIPGLKFRYRSFISHHQLISKEILQELKKQISNDEKLLWTRILFTIQNNKNWFSEYELYGSFANQFYSDRIKLVYWYNKNLYSKNFQNADLQLLEKKHISVSFHNHGYETYKNNP